MRKPTSYRPDLTSVDEHALVMKALGNRQRIEILRLTRRHAAGFVKRPSLIARELATPITASAVTKHLEILETAGLIVTRVVGANRVKRITINTLSTGFRRHALSCALLGFATTKMLRLWHAGEDRKD